MPAPEIDVLIHGAGPVGCTLALALRGTRLRIAVFDKTSLAPSFRPIALSYASRLILERIGAWQTATPIETIQDRKSTRLNSSHSQISYAVFCLKKKNIGAARPPPRFYAHKPWLGRYRCLGIWLLGRVL